MIKARRLEAWLADWVERNSDLKVLHDGGKVTVHEDYYASVTSFSVTRLAEDLVVALAEEGLDRA